MKKYNLSFLPFIIASSLYSTMSFADLSTQCLLGIPHFSGEIIKGNPNQLPVYIEADNAELNGNTSAIYNGDVEIQQGNRYLGARSAQLTQLNKIEGTNQKFERQIDIQGGFAYRDESIYLLGDSAKFDLNTKSTDIGEALYQLVDRQGRGEAQAIELRSNDRLLKNATFTTCLPNNNSWSITAAEMRQDIKEEYAEMWHARFNVAGVPVFYTPYLQFPIGDRRRSGLLMPTYGSSGKDGLWYEQPFYWNIAPNVDATFYAKYMSQRGWQGKTEFRYLTRFGEGKIAGEYIKNDRYDEYVDKDNSRHLIYWEHHANLVNNLRFDADYTKASDPNYFSDFSSSYGSSTDGYANQEFKLSYVQPHYDVKLSTLQFQIFDTQHSNTYRKMPQLDVNYYKDDLPYNLDFQLFSQAVHFTNENKSMPEAWRYHFQPSLSLPLSNKYGSVSFDTTLLATHYDQKKGSAKNAPEVKDSVNRVLPQFGVDIKTLLARHYDNGIIQTIEPKAQYLYRPFRDQADIGRKGSYGYDSSSSYNGLDRILSANQVKWGGTTRFYDSEGVERFNTSIEQTYYLSDTKAEENKIHDRKASADWELKTNWFINPEWNWRASYKYDAEYKHTSSANTTLEYTPGGENLVQLTYRYISNKEFSESQNDIKQLGLTTAWSINDNWSLVTKYYHDFGLKKPVEQYIGARYNTCCWSLGVGVNRYVEQRNDQQPHEVLYDHSIGVNFELRGFGNDHRSGIEKMLKEGKLPYIQSFSLY